MRKKLKIPKKSLEKLYIEEEKDSREIAKKFNCSPSTILSRLKEYSIETRKRTGKYEFPIKKSPEFSYFIGAMLGDGWVGKQKDNRYGFILRVTDKEFADKVNTCFSKIINKEKKNVLIHQSKENPRKDNWISKGYSKKLYEWWVEKDMDELIDFAKKYPDNFLRGLFDADGTSQTPELTNSNLDLLKKVKKILGEEFNINSKIYLKDEEGSEIRSYGKVYERNKDVYELRASDPKKFAEEINFSIPRKRI